MLVTVTSVTVRALKSGSNWRRGSRVGNVAAPGMFMRLASVLACIGLVGAAARMCRVLTLPLRAKTLTAALHCCVLSLPLT